MLITVSGPAGSGKSTLAASLADALDYDHVSGGDIFRSLAEERDMTPLELNRAAEDDDQIDRDLDRRLRDIAAERDEVVLESRLAGRMAGEHADIKLWLTAPLDVRADRIAQRENKPFDQARTETEERSRSEAQRYAEYYDIDFEDRSIYDLAENTARWGEDAMVEIVATAIEAYDPENDEGSVSFDVRYEF